MLSEAFEMAAYMLLDGPILPIMLGMFILVTLPRIVKSVFYGSSNRSERSYRLITEDEYEQYIKGKPKKVSLDKKKSGTTSSSSNGKSDNSSSYDQFPSVYNAAVYSSSFDSCSDSGSSSSSNCD